MAFSHKHLLASVSFAVAFGFGAVGAASAGSFFERINSYPVYKTLAEGVDPATETVAEIISASKDGRTLGFTDSPGEAIVFVNATNPTNIQPKARVALGGEPTSVAFGAKAAYAGVNTSEDYINASGHLAVIELENMGIVAKCDAKGQPDSVAVSADGKFVAIAIENERDEDLNDGVLPQMPAGHLAIFDLDADGKPTNCDNVRIVDMTGLAEVGGTDPEPEFVSVNSKNQAVVTLQENNHLAIVDLASGEITAHFSAGGSSADAIPVSKDLMSDASGSIKDVAREPDAVAWIDDERFVTANEGDYKGGSRGFTIWNAKGDVLFDSGNAMEHLGMSHGHYPAKRASKKGTEPEGVAVGEFGGETLIFVNSERGNFVAVYKDTGAAPEFIQFLPTHVGPEGLLAIPSRDLFAVANEVDEDGVRAHVSLYQFGAEAPAYPTIVSETDPETRGPIGWGALSALAADPSDANKIYAVTDSFYDKSKILTVDISSKPAKITGAVVLHGSDTAKYDLEGVAVSKDGGFWLASEGHPEKELKHLLLKASADGAVQEEIELPAELIAQAERHAFEGVAEFEKDGQTLVAVALQREWKDDPKGMVKLAIYNPADKSWGFVHYPLDAPASQAGGWVGLSEIVSLGGEEFAILERDNKGGEDAAIKQITVVSLKGISPAKYGDDLPVLEKRMAMDILPALAASKGWVLDKPEGLTVTAGGRLILVTDNDGVDDAPGETLLIDLGPATRLN
ncbi:esterase-like activity of phytase family protein [Roseibium polysiphoniae]|uniref:Esterase-like activity of phytase family protein n=1 Tax=Roseibium polysiphoniae TaxID=2571221 RepID=A0A944GTQ5_9HYPH|nr:esterase-like activity of phytase family protein [Roseibium polysiphoniae]MBS8262043.1 esterase-like activity of phytase family protein [Roseibium polysiphoniae]